MKIIVYSLAIVTHRAKYVGDYDNYCNIGIKSSEVLVVVPDPGPLGGSTW